MVTRALIAYIKKEAKDASDDYIRELLNEIQLMVYTNKTMYHMQLWDSATGKDPKFTATAGTYEYTVSTAEGFADNAWRVTAVYTLANGIDNPTDTILIDGDPNGYAKIRFKADPGTQDYYYRAYKFPTEITTVTTPLTIPASYHLSHVAEGVIGILEKNKSGQSQRWVDFINKLLPDMINGISAGQNSWSKTDYRGW